MAGFHTAAKLRTAGLPGLAEGLQLMTQMLDTWGINAHPVVDVTNPISVLERLQALVCIAAPYNRDGDLLRIIEGVRKTPLVETSSREFNHAYLLSGLTNDDENLDWEINEAFKQAWAREPKARKDAIIDAIDSSLASLAGIANWIGLNLPDNLVPSNPAISSVAPLVAELQNIKQAIARADESPQMDGPADELATAGESLPSGRDTNVPPSTALPAPKTGIPVAPAAGIPALVIQNRADAVLVLGRVKAYFKANEPTSPAIFYIERAINLVGRDFLEALTALMPEAATKFEEMLGIKKSE